jgi:serine/threonine protein kinase
MMEKLPGVPISRVCRENKMETVAVFEMLRQLAEVRKTLARHTWPEIGSLSMAGDNVVVERQVTNRNYFDGWAKIRSRPGPFSSSSITYYANLLNQSWTAAQNTFPDSTEAWVRWKVHAYLCSILSSYVEPDVNQFILAHTDLNPSNILVDPQTGAITDIIDWEFACTVPLQAPEHFPLLLRQRVFTNEFDDVYDDPEAELNEWRSFYAKQFEGDPAMEEYLQNVDAAIAFENILKNNDLATIENLVEKCKFLESAETLETMEVPFPWKSPTKHRFPPPPTTEPESESTPTAEITEIAAETEQDDFPTTNGGDDKSTLSPSSIIDTGHERPAPPSTTEKAEQALLTQQQISHNDSPTTNDEAEKPTIQPSQPLAHTDHADTPAAPPKKAETSVQTDDVSPTTTTVAVQTTFSLPVIHNRPDATTDTLEEAGALSFESRSLNSFVGVVQRRGGLVGGINTFRRGVRSGGMKVWRVVICRRKRLGEESEKQRRRDV